MPIDENPTPSEISFASDDDVAIGGEDASEDLPRNEPVITGGNADDQIIQGAPDNTQFGSDANPWDHTVWEGQPIDGDLPSREYEDPFTDTFTLTPGEQDRHSPDREGVTVSCDDSSTTLIIEDNRRYDDGYSQPIGHIDSNDLFPLSRGKGAWGIRDDAELFSNERDDDSPERFEMGVRDLGETDINGNVLPETDPLSNDQQTPVDAFTESLNQTFSDEWSDGYLDKDDVTDPVPVRTFTDVSEELEHDGDNSGFVG